MNDLVNAPATDLADQNALSQFSENLTRTRSGMQTGFGSYLSFGKDGEWRIGRGADSSAMNGEEMLIHPMSIKVGYVCWSRDDGRSSPEKLGEEMRFISEEPVDQAILPELGGKWQKQFSVTGRLLEGDQDQVVYETASMGGQKAMDGLFSELQKRIAASPGAFVFPVVRLDPTHYMHKRYGKVYNPHLAVVGWADESGNPAPS